MQHAAGRVPRSITVDHDTEFMSKALEAWALYRGVQLDFTRPGKPTDNSHIESFGIMYLTKTNHHGSVSL